MDDRVKIREMVRLAKGLRDGKCERPTSILGTAHLLADLVLDVHEFDMLVDSIEQEHAK